MGDFKKDNPRRKKLPPWLKVKLPSADSYHNIKHRIESAHTHTVCEEAGCPNMGECWSRKTATILILGDTCTRRCDYCRVKTGKPSPPDEREPSRVAAFVKGLGLQYAVITSVTRDDLSDGGASFFQSTILNIRKTSSCKIEVLTPDYLDESLAAVIGAAPEVFGHNLETVERLFPGVRHRGSYQRSLEVLCRAKQLAPTQKTKSGIMIGLGETPEEIMQTMKDLKEQKVDYVTIGQYLQPSLTHIEVARFYTPREFDAFKNAGISLGFAHVESGPLVRSSYRAERALNPEAAGQ